MEILFSVPAAFLGWVLTFCFLGYKACEEHQRSRETKAEGSPSWDYEPGR